MTERSPIPACLSHLTQRDAAVRARALEAKWTDALVMVTMPTGWYWGEFPGSWLWYSPKLNKARCIDHGDIGWHDLLAKRYWGPWTPEIPTPPAPAPDEAAIRAELIAALRAMEAGRG